MVAEAFSLGNWKSLIEVEESLTMRELGLLLQAKYKDIKNEHQFVASLKGVELPDGDEEEEGMSTFDQIKARADAVLAGKSPEEADSHKEQSFFEMVGIDVEAD